jgi:hypothetical protein
VKFVFFIILISSLTCSSRKPESTMPTFRDYESFVSSYSKKADPIAEIYGQYSAEQSDKRVRAKFNLLVDPGQRAYIEILDPSDRLLNVLSLTQKEVALFWPKENVYIREEATPQNLQKVLGLPVNADDALQLISGRGLQFIAWQQEEVLEHGWRLSRGPSSAEITAKENLSEIETTTRQGKFVTSYDKYEYLSEKSMPTRIRFEIPARKTTLELNIDKYLPRTDPPTDELFDIKLAANARKLALNEIYKGKPLILE